MLELYERSPNKTLVAVYISFLKLLLLQLLCWFDLFHGLIRFENFKLRLIRLHISHDLEIIFKNNNYELKLKFHSHLILPPTHHSSCIILDAHDDFYTDNIESVTGYVMWTPYRVCVCGYNYTVVRFLIKPPAWCHGGNEQHKLHRHWKKKFFSLCQKTKYFSNEYSRDAGMK